MQRFPNVVDAYMPLPQRKQRVDAVIIYCVLYEFFLFCSYRVNNCCDYYYRSSAKSGDVRTYTLLHTCTHCRLFIPFIFISFSFDALNSPQTVLLLH